MRMEFEMWLGEWMNEINVNFDWFIVCMNGIKLNNDVVDVICFYFL